MSYDNTRRAARAVEPAHVPELTDREAWIVDNEPTRYHLDRCSSVRAADHGGVLAVVPTAELAGRVLCGLCAVVYGHHPPDDAALSDECTAGQHDGCPGRAVDTMWNDPTPCYCPCHTPRARYAGPPPPPYNATPPHPPTAGQGGRG